jgi:hypothetical protein
LSYRSPSHEQTIRRACLAQGVAEFGVVRKFLKVNGRQRWPRHPRRVTRQVAPPSTAPCAARAADRMCLRRPGSARTRHRSKISERAPGAATSSRHATRAASPAPGAQGGRTCPAPRHPARQGQARAARRSPPASGTRGQEPAGRGPRSPCNIRASRDSEHGVPAVNNGHPAAVSMIAQNSLTCGNASQAGWPGAGSNRRPSAFHGASHSDRSASRQLQVAAKGGGMAISFRRGRTTMWAGLIGQGRVDAGPLDRAGPCCRANRETIANQGPAGRAAGDDRDGRAHR